MTELLVLGLKLAFLALLWLFVLFAGNIIRTDLFGRAVPAEQVPTALPPQKPAPRKQRRLPRTLRITQGTQSGLTLPLGDVVRIGRSPDAQLVLEDDYVSTRHARIYRTPDGYVVEDLGSTNGTYLNNTRLTGPTPFTTSDTLRIGRTLMIVEK